MTEDNGAGRLPKGAERVMALVTQSRPTRKRPRLSSEFEEQLAEIDAQSAACYASMEDLGDKLASIAEVIGNGGGVIVEEMDEDADSVVTHLDEITNELRSSRDRLAAAPNDDPPPPIRRLRLKTQH